jgi:hypothetical protein
MARRLPRIESYSSETRRPESVATTGMGVAQKRRHRLLLQLNDFSHKWGPPVINLVSVGHARAT